MTRSYAQYGEDQIILALLYIFNLTDVNYMDIGANDPWKLNNTALLYERGITGMNIEPDPENFLKLSTARQHDLNLNIGIGSQNDLLTYYRFVDSVYNTFSAREYHTLVNQQNQIPLPSLEIEVRSYADVVETELHGIPPVLLFVDTEGLDEEIIESTGFDLYPPKVLCIETFSYGEFRKDQALIDKIRSKGYHVHADTFVNTIFIHQSLLPYPVSANA
ncbi:FkbM family methyltransferase [Mucilaginibacter sp.]|uniref:FkbM family methyltransferase n=1 Tax=Mucilaginibacter sp. TaxID=1882438 RepID=UPI0035BBE688